MSDDNGMSLKLILEFPSEWELREFFESYEVSRKSALVLGELRTELRAVIKYGEPTDRDRHWYDRFWELCEEHNLDGWGV